MLGSFYQRKKILNQRASVQVDHFLLDLERARSIEHEIWRPARTIRRPPGGGLNRQSLQPGPVANHERRSFQPDQPLFLQMT